MKLPEIFFKSSTNINKLYKTILLLQFLILFGPLCVLNNLNASQWTVASNQNNPDEVHNYQSLNEVDQLISKLTIEEKIGQLFVFGFKEQEFTPSLERFLNTYKPGGLIFFSRNGKSPEKVLKLIQDIKAYYKKINKIEPFFVVDHEGGDVVRVGPPHFFPSALSLGQTKDQAISYELGKWTGNYLKNLGFDINLAPVVDLRSESSVNFIGERSFSSSPDDVVKIVGPFISGARAAGVLSVLKHFPGHGRLQEDSHFEVVRKISNETELNQKDLLPFKKLIKQHPSTAVMTSHLSVPALDPSGELTTFSKPIVSKLTNEYQHEGLVLSDDFDMLFFKDKTLNVGQRSLDALKAGHDQVLIVWSKANQLKAQRHIKEQLLSKSLPEDFIDDKLKKILATKLRLKDDRTLSYEKVKKSLAKIYSLQEQISYIHFNKLPKNLIQEISTDLDSKKSVYLFSYSYLFYKNFKDNFSKGGFIPLSQDQWVNALKRCEKHICFFHVSGDQSALRAKEIPKELQKHMIVLNTSDPTVTKDVDSKKLNLYTKSNKFWKWFAEELERIKDSYAAVQKNKSLKSTHL